MSWDPLDFNNAIDKAFAAGEELIKQAESAIQRQRDAFKQDIQDVLSSITIRLTK